MNINKSKIRENKNLRTLEREVIKAITINIKPLIIRTVVQSQKDLLCMLRRRQLM